MEEGFSNPFPVVLSDGKHEIHIDNVRIHPSLEFKHLQSGIGRKIGVSPNRIIIYLVDRDNSKSPLESSRQILITAKSNFTEIIAGQKDSSLFLVVVDQSKREKMPVKEVSPSEKFLLLRRNQPESSHSQVSRYFSSYYNQNIDALKNLMIQREKYLRMNSSWTSNLDLNSFSRTEDSDLVSTTATNYLSMCEECANAKEEGTPATFHPCVRDPVVIRFRSTAGPIARPHKPSPLSDLFSL